eukprot:2771670-Pyramimonas_sp.AAC.1
MPRLASVYILSTLHLHLPVYPQARARRRHSRFASLPPLRPYHRSYQEPRPEDARVNHARTRG